MATGLVAQALADGYSLGGFCCLLSKYREGRTCFHKVLLRSSFTPVWLEAGGGLELGVLPVSRRKSVVAVGGGHCSHFY